MHLYIKAVFAVIAFSTLGLSAKAADKVWYCEMTEFVEIFGGELNRIKPERFKMKIDDRRVVFSSEGFLADNYIDIEDGAWIKYNIFRANGDHETLNFIDGSLAYSMIAGVSIYSFHANCEVF